ncbi:MAG: MgtC/SapB family protein [Firmicutes bacterium]|nr:MgtC/SapB family protein [Bacillota bacterium]
MPFILSVIVRLILAGIMGGIVGYEREHTQRPAGFRTHILVCVGAALVMITSEFIFERYHALANLDPARLGAQVISGIGFLGAGTIIREGFSVKGLTTAASLWAVSCVGITVGAGLYSGAVVATIFIFITLLALKKFETSISKTSRYGTIFVQLESRPGLIGEISALLESCGVIIRNIEYENDQNKEKTSVKLAVRFPVHFNGANLMNELLKIPGIKKASTK